ncbi:Hsp20/alpha crystallin family protein [Candidatus Nitrospira bockiana]
MELMSKLKEIVPWKRKQVETREVMTLRDDINRLFDRFLMSPFRWDWGWGGGSDLEETEDGVLVRVDVPGLDPKRLDVTVRDGVLHIRYEGEDEWKDDDGHAWARRYGAFHRAIALPEGLDTNRATAVCKHGLLTVRFPWTQQAKEDARRIVVSIQ